MNRGIALVLILLSLGVFWLAGESHSDLKGRRAEFNPEVIPEEGIPPEVMASTVLLGPMRGLLVDALWVRLNRLQEEGRYFEIVQLADWISQLEPRFAEVWAFQGWNMTYNISVLFNEPEERWRWVSHGISLLRDRGLKYNPQNPTLHWELGWFYQHKIGQDLDTMHIYYKQQLRHEMNMLLGGKHKLDYERLAKLPADRETLLEDPDIQALVEGLEGSGIDPFSPRLLTPYGLDEEAAAQLNAQPGFLKLHGFIQKTVLRETYKLDFDVMEDVDRDHGPFDWRTPHAHAVYWAYRGTKFAEGFDKVRMRRMIFQSMLKAYQEGWFEQDEKTGILLRSANLDIIARVNEAYLDGIKDHPAEKTYKTAHRNFLADAILNLFEFGRPKVAKEYFAFVVENYPEEDSEDGFESFIYQAQEELNREALSYDEMNNLLESKLMQSYVFLITGKTKIGKAQATMAKVLYDEFQRDHTDADGTAQRIYLDPWPNIQARALFRLRENLGENKAAMEELKKIPTPPTLN